MNRMDRMHLGQHSIDQSDSSPRHLRGISGFSCRDGWDDG